MWWINIKIEYIFYLFQIVDSENWVEELKNFTLVSLMLEKENCSLRNLSNMKLMCKTSLYTVEIQVKLKSQLT